MEFIKVKIKTSENNGALVRELLNTTTTITLKELDETTLELQTRTQNYYSDINSILNINGILHTTTSEANELENVDYRDNIIAVCDDCDAYITEYAGTNETHNGATICNECYNYNYFTCFDCDEIFHNNYQHETHDGDYICDDCYYDNYFTCNGCGEVYRTDDGYYNDDEDEYYCGNCYDQYCDDGGSELLQGYHDHARDFNHILKTSDSDNLNYTIGYELETERGNSSVTRSEYCKRIEREINSNERLVHFETDSSLDNGVEIISEPMTLEYWNAQKDNKIKALINLCHSMNYRSHNGGNCGLHVHFNKKFFGETSDEQQQKINTLLLFFETYRDEITKLSRRERFSYCQFLSKKTSDLVDLKDEKQKQNIATSINYIERAKQYTGHGDAINVNASTGKTFEVRIMRGTLKHETFTACIEFIVNLIQCIANEPRENISFTKVVNYKPTTYLKQYIAEREIKANYKKLKDNSEKAKKYATALELEIDKKTKTINNLLERYIRRRYNNIKKQPASIFTGASALDNLEHLKMDTNFIEYINMAIRNIATKDYWRASEILRYRIDGDKTNEIANEIDNITTKQRLVNIING